MFWQRVSSALLAGALIAASSMTARAEQDKPAAPEKVAAPEGAKPADACTAYRTICCTEWVPEKYFVERRTTKVEWKQEQYTAYKCECVPVQKKRTCTVYKMVPEVREETRIVCKKVPCEEERTVYEKRTVCVPCEKTVRKCVDKGHYECKLVEDKSGEGFLAKLCGKKKKEDDCCNPCPPCPKMKEVKVWVPCPVWEEHKVCTTEKRTECVAKKIKVTVCKEVREEQKVKVTVCKCVPEQREECYTVYEQKMTPYQATRCVKVCTPCVEKVECCRMVKRTVMKQVPCEPCCNPCCDPCCEKAAPKKKGLFGK
jgi:hypothetical protein